MSPEKIGANNTETSEVNDASEVLTNKERTAENDVQKWADETHLDSEKTDLGTNENREGETELTFDETIDLILNDSDFVNQPESIKSQIRKLVKDNEEIKLIDPEFALNIPELKEEIHKNINLEKTASVEDEFNNRNEALVREGKSQKERLTILLNEYESSTEIPTYLDSVKRALAVLNFAETDKTITKEEKELIQNKLGSADLFSPGGFETAMYAVYEDESISEETREKLIQVSGVVDVPKINIKTVSNLSDDLKNRNEAREDQYDKLKDSEKAIKKELAKKKKELEEIPGSERTEEQVAELEALEEQLKTVKKQKEYFDESNRNIVTRRPLGIGGTAEMSQKSLFRPVRTIIELNGIRLPLDPSSSEKQNLGITCLHSYNQMENGSGKRKPMHLGKLVFDEIRNGKALKESQYDKTDVISNAMGFENGEIITKEQLRQEEMVFHAFRNPDSPRTPQGAKQDLRGLGLLKEGENKMSYEGVVKMADMIHHIRNVTKLPTGYKSKYDYLKDTYKKKDDEK